MKEISKAKVICKAFLDTALMKIPSNEKDFPEWYKNRMDTCKVCKFNTRNIPYRMLPSYYMFNKLLGKYQCSICSCFIKQKAWSKTEECGLGETDYRPDWMTLGYLEEDGLAESTKNRSQHGGKWNRIEVVTSGEDDFDFVSLEEDKYNIKLNSQGGVSFQLYLEPLDLGKDAEFSFGLRAKRDVEIVSTHVSCSCTTPKLEVLSDNDFKFSMKIHTKGFGEGAFVKHMTLEYHLMGEESSRNLEFDFFGYMVKRKKLSEILEEDKLNNEQNG